MVLKIRSLELYIWMWIYDGYLSFGIPVSVLGVECYKYIRCGILFTGGFDGYITCVLLG